ncbi:MAG: twin-arginine translocase subunit TatC [Bacteroidales bacterium]|nr:twin-arginine translocase subunit TatC [Bacteroidales bacterium]
MSSPAGGSQKSFWDHLEELRWVFLRAAVVLITLFVVLFFFKGLLFDTVVLGPARDSFWLYRLLGLEPAIKLVNIDVTAQFFIHIRIAFLAAVVLAFPYLVFELWRFVVPALYEREKVAFRKALGLGGGLFYAGILCGYFIVMPLVMYFFAGYRVSDAVENTFNLSSYISVFTAMVFMMGILFEFPSVILVLSSLGVVDRQKLKSFRKYALVIVLILAAILTPTGDPFTLMVVSVPLYLLYEFSIALCGK